ncbi:MAG: photosynthetic reaction center cytochrome c subunit [Bacteroidetes bacterium]|nr:MAG: photosynthetic reaction center cytochrome c subunit [Bacteroidota bacterium]
MKTKLIFLTFALAALWLADCTTSNTTAPAGTVTLDAKAQDRTQQIEKLRASLGDKTELPATEVFQNISRLKNITAGRLLEVMDIWGKVLNVRCDFCHVQYEWASEVKPEKATTRQMFDLTNKINADLRSIDLDGISCYTCHRGSTHPATRPKE